MTAQELLELMERTHRRSHVIGTANHGIIVGLDVEGRLFAVHNNRVLNRVVPSAFEGRSNALAYLNPGGDALWPAPEGTCFGYEYATGKWRVPPAITGAVWEVVESLTNRCVIQAEIDLINNRGLGIPALFQREIQVAGDDSLLVQTVTETIRYLGTETLEPDSFRLAPWSLCQFDVTKDSRLVTQWPDDGQLWDFYSDSSAKRTRQGELCIADAVTDERFQWGLSPFVSMIEYHCPGHFRVSRTVIAHDQSESFIDIADSDPRLPPSSKQTKLSAYCDPSGFVELEACGTCPMQFHPGEETSVTVKTEFFISG